MSSEPLYTLYALKYAERAAKRSDHFYPHDPHEGPMPMDYFVWVIKGADRAIVVDAGFTAPVAAQRGRTHLRCPIESLHLLDLDPASIDTAVLTHFHYDHVGNLPKLPHATFIVQDDEMRFWTGRYAGRGHFRGLVEPDDVVHLVRENFGGRVRFIDGVGTIAPGITVHRVGGHAPGLQVVRVPTARGTVVLASDAVHFYANLDDDRLFSHVLDVPAMYGAFDIVRELADSDDHIIPGHDPLVMQRYPAASPELAGIVARLA